MCFLLCFTAFIFFFVLKLQLSMNQAGDDMAKVFADEVESVKKDVSMAELQKYFILGSEEAKESLRQAKAYFQVLKEEDEKMEKEKREWKERVRQAKKEE